MGSIKYEHVWYLTHILDNIYDRSRDKLVCIRHDSVDVLFLLGPSKRSPLTSNHISSILTICIGDQLHVLNLVVCWTGSFAVECAVVEVLSSLTGKERSARSYILNKDDEKALLTWRIYKQCN